MHYSAKCSLAISCRVSISLFVCDVDDCYDIGWNSSKIISWLVSLGMFALCRPQHDGSTPRGTPQNFRLNGGRVRKKVIFGVQKL